MLVLGRDQRERERERERARWRVTGSEREMGKVAALVLVFFLLSSQMDSVKPSAADCLDACSTACVQRDTRKMARCEGKCKIKCEPAFAAEVGHGF